MIKLTARVCPGWINLPSESVWIYAVLGILIILIAASGLFFFLRRRKSVGSSKVSTEKEFTDSWEKEVVNSIKDLKNTSKAVLLGAAGLDCMPVTIPIRTIINLAGGSKCVLIDMDTKRDAVAKVFHLSAEPPADLCKPLATGIEGVSAIPAHYFAQNPYLNIQSVLGSVRGSFDIIVINAPFLDGHPDRNLIASQSDFAFLFAGRTDQMIRLRKLCEQKNCRVLGCYRTKNNVDNSSLEEACGILVDNPQDSV